MNAEDKLLSQLYDHHLNRIVNRVLYALRKLKEGNLFSGDDSHLGY